MPKRVVVFSNSCENKNSLECEHNKPFKVLHVDDRFNHQFKIDLNGNDNLIVIHRGNYDNVIESVISMIRDTNIAIR